jgi:hypothetical protein
MGKSVGTLSAMSITSFPPAGPPDDQAGVAIAGAVAHYDDEDGGEDGEDLQLEVLHGCLFFT